MLRLSDINRKLGDFSLSDIHLEISEGQYYVLLGRSGAGKTQLLELIAGLEFPDSGTIMLDNEDITRKKIQDRQIGIVFQDYAVFPHMTVYGNIAYPLKVRKKNKKLIAEEVEKAADAVNIGHLLERSTKKLSGGELQRVALARTLITSPRLLLLDEPLSSLDASLKDDMKHLLRKLNRAGQTIIHVTHDYHDAISLARRVGVIHNGRIIQEGPVEEVFKNPANRFVARYAGIRNFFNAVICQDDGKMTAVTRNKLRFRLNGDHTCKDCLLIIKSDAIHIYRNTPVNSDFNTFRAKITEIVPSEFGFELTIFAGEPFFVNVQSALFNELNLVEEQEVWINIPPEAIVVLNSMS